MSHDRRPDNGNPWSGFAGHEEVVIAEADGVRIAIALHSTRLGPALGGTRMASYTETADPGAAAYADALRLSRAMTYKNALAGLDHGGGKGVIVADPTTKPVALLHAYGRLVESLDGRYVTAGDVGMSVEDMDTIGEVCRWTTGRSPANGGVGDSGILTAFGVFQGMRAGAESVWGTPDLAGRRVGIVGAGKVGGRLIGHLVDAGAEVVTVDRGEAARAAVAAQYPSVTFLESSDALIDEPLDILSPNALGGFLTTELVPRITARLVCGGANNQLASPEVGDLLAARGIVYTPDFMVNCGGVIQVAEELVGCDLGRARERTARVYETTLRVLDRAQREGVTPVVAAEQEAEDRIARGPGG